MDTLFWPGAQLCSPQLPQAPSALRLCSVLVLLLLLLMFVVFILFVFMLLLFCFQRNRYECFQFTCYFVPQNHFDSNQ